MKINIKKTNPTKYRFSILVAFVTLAHVISLIAREHPPQVYLSFDSLIPFRIVMIFGIVGFILWTVSIVQKKWELLQMSLFIMTLFYLFIDLSLILSNAYNGAIMWSGAVFICILIFKMKPIELIRGQKEDGQ